MRRRQFLGVLGGAAGWPLAARAQQPQRIRRIGVLMFSAVEEPESQARLAAFLERLQKAGWVVGRDLQLEYRWSAGDPARLRRHAAELAALRLDVILGGVGPTAEILHQVARDVPVVFAQTIDPVGNAVVASLSRPGGNATGFMQFEYSLAGKWPELLKEILPSIARAAVLRDPAAPAGIGQWAVIQATAPASGIEVFPIENRSASDIERGVRAIAGHPNCGLIVAVSAAAITHSKLIIELAAQLRLPAVYADRHFVTAGGLVSYGPNLMDLYRSAAVYVDRILKGEKPLNLPVQAPNKYELAINLKTAKALGLTVPPMLIARADEVIE